jgi:hypothetical protein
MSLSLSRHLLGVEPASRPQASPTRGEYLQIVLGILFGLTRLLVIPGMA